MNLNDIINEKIDVNRASEMILKDIHENGPVKAENLEALSYIKKFHPEIFKKYEPKLTYLLGLFFKTSKPQTLLEAVYNTYAETIFEKTKKKLTPVQASIYDGILNKKYYSFSAPTSTGKSFLLREIINDYDKDIVVVVPSRALIAEYMAAILQSLENDNSVLILQFVENINKANTDRRIFIITPERGGDLFRALNDLNIGLFIFDEAQISEEPIRGMTFDALVRRVDKLCPSAKKVFTHPFVDNPEAQLEKHGFPIIAGSAPRFGQHSVGKICLSFKANEFKYFSPYEDKSKITTIEKSSEDIVENILTDGRTLLVYISKSDIYQRKHSEKFQKYIDICPAITSVKANQIINRLRNFIGAEKQEKYSHMIGLMEKGIVIHHGSIPLKGRLLIEKFVNEGFAKICFATSTLIQGINMPFDAVWIENFKFQGSSDDKVLGIKNLIGRAGRTTKKISSFDYGYVIVKESNRDLFAERISEHVKLKPESSLDQDLTDIPEDLKDLAEAIKNDTFNTELNLTETQITRIKEEGVTDEIVFILDNFIKGQKLITEAEYRKIEDKQRLKIKESFQTIYLSHLRKEELSKREKTILSTAVSIMLWRVQGKSFKEIISLRHSYLAQKSVQRAIDKKRKKGLITEEEAFKLKFELKIKHSQQADRLPSSETGTFRLFGVNESVLDLDYDKLVYDTYDYLDKVISQCLVDPISGALRLYYDKSQDERALALSNYIRYGTNDAKEIWLLRYGFEPEDVEWIKLHVEKVDENRIKFKETIKDLSKKKLRIIQRYL